MPWSKVGLYIHIGTWSSIHIQFGHDTCISTMVIFMFDQDLWIPTTGWRSPCQPGPRSEREAWSGDAKVPLGVPWEGWLGSTGKKRYRFLASCTSALFLAVAILLCSILTDMFTWPCIFTIQLDIPFVEYGKPTIQVPAVELSFIQQISTKLEAGLSKGPPHPATFLVPWNAIIWSTLTRHGNWKPIGLKSSTHGNAEWQWLDTHSG